MSLSIKEVIKQLKVNGEKSKFFRSIKRKFKANGELTAKQERALRDLMTQGKERKKMLLKCVDLFPKDAFVISVNEHYKSEGFISKKQYTNLKEKIEDAQDDSSTEEE